MEEFLSLESDFPLWHCCAFQSFLCCFFLFFSFCECQRSRDRLLRPETSLEMGSGSLWKSGQQSSLSDSRGAFFYHHWIACDKRIFFGCTEPSLSEAATQKSCIIKPTLLQFRNIIQIVPTLLSYDCFVSVYVCWILT